MAIISIPILGSASGRFADAEFLKLHGRNILRSKKLKRYKPRNATNRYYEVLLKKIVLAASPIISFLRLAYTPRKKYYNFFNQFIHDFYYLFSLNSQEYLLCSNTQLLHFSTASFLVNVIASISSYTGAYLIFNTNLPPVYLSGDYEFFLVLSTNNFRNSQLQVAQIYDVANKQLQYFYPAPPFNSADYDVFLVIRSKLNNTYSNTSFLFRFSH